MPRRKLSSREKIVKATMTDISSEKLVRDTKVIEEVVDVGRNNIGVAKTIIDKSGRIVGRTVSPLMLKFEAKDVAQVFIGSLLLASPFLVTQEVWDLGREIHIYNAIAIVFISLLSLIILIYYTRYQRVRTLEGKIPKGEFIKRIFGTYLITLFIVGVLLTAIDRAPWFLEFDVALKRTIIVSLPACLGGAVADLLK